MGRAEKTLHTKNPTYSDGILQKELGILLFLTFHKITINALLHSFLQMSLPKVWITNQKVKRLNNKHYEDIADFSNSNESNTPLNMILH